MAVALLVGLATFSEQAPMYDRGFYLAEHPHWVRVGDWDDSFQHEHDHLVRFICHLYSYFVIVSEVWGVCFPDLFKILHR